MLRYYLLIFAIIISNANGVVLSPLVEEICSKQITPKNSIKNFTTTNSTDNIIGVEVVLKRVIKRENNKEVREDVKGALDWYPKQFILRPKTSKNFRVQLNMDTMPDKEYTYRVIVKEHPLNFTKKTQEDIESNKVKTSLRMVFNYEGFLFVRKCNYRYNLEIKKFFFDKQNGTFKLDIQNSGKKSVVPSIKSLNFIVKTANKEFNLQGTFIKTKRIYPDTLNTFEFKLKQEDDILHINNSNIISVDLIKKD